MQLSQLVDSFLIPEAFDDDHKLVHGTPDSEGGEDGGLTVPGGTSVRAFMEWVKRLPEREPPIYLGLPANAEKLLLVGHGKNIIGDLAKIVEILDEGEQLMVE